MSQEDLIDFSKLNVARTGHNYLMKVKGGDYTVDELNMMNGYVKFLLDAQNREFKKYKVGVLLMCVNQNYWPFLADITQDIKNMFLPGHDVEMMIWSDLPNHEAGKGVDYGAKMFPIDSVEWPYPTLMRYHTFLQEEEHLKQFDYLFYIDADMRIVNIVGDEILGEGLTAAEHPMYALRREYIPPYEPNRESSAFIPRLGMVVNQDGKPWFKPAYVAGGFQGGKTALFIQAMKEMKKTIDSDFNKNYIAIWNDESHWNRYLYGYSGHLTLLSPSYVYPDSLIDQYYKKVWGRDYPPKIITLTKKFTVNKQAGEELRKRLESM